MSIKQRIVALISKQKSISSTPHTFKPLPEFWTTDNLYQRPISNKNVRWAYLSMDAKIIYIHNTKCGSTSLKYKLFEATRGYPYAINIDYPEQNIHFSPHAFARVGLMGSRFNSPSQPTFNFATIKQACQDNNAFLFTFVRHPYQRAISAYYSKIVKDEHHTYFAIKDTLICQYGLDLSAPNKPQNFHQFLQYLLDQQASNHLTDVHFLPQTSTLDFENTSFDFIGKIENFKKDQETLMQQIEQKTGSALYPTKFPHRALNKSSKQNDVDRYSPGKAEKIMLQKIYQRDFDLLGYLP